MELSQVNHAPMRGDESMQAAQITEASKSEVQKQDLRGQSFFWGRKKCEQSAFTSITAQTVHATHAGEQETLEQDATPVDFLVQRKWFITAREGDIRERYEFQDRVGAGAFGSVYRVRDPLDGQLYAVKTVLKSRMEDLQIFVNEISVLRNLDHPNILNIYEVWESEDLCSIVTQYLPAGSLLSYCNSRQLPLPQQEICEIMRPLMRALRYLHSISLVHADIKLENCLFSSLNLDSLHLIDFGLSVNTKKPREIPTAMRGTLNYMSPELFSCSLTRPLISEMCKSIDVWAAGVILFTLSCGFLPFEGESQMDIICQMKQPEQKIHARLTQAPQFQCLNPLLKDLILQMLRVHPPSRLTSSQVLKHPFMINARNQDLIHAKKFVNIDDLKAMAVYGKTPILKKLTLMYLAVHLDEAACAEIKRKFEAVDRDDSGSISQEEFNRLFKDQTNSEGVPLRCTNMLFDMMDTSKTKRIEFSEFKAALLRTTMYLNHNQLRKAFCFFDRDGSGHISTKELQSVFQTFEDLFNLYDAADYDGIIAQADLNSNGRLSYDDFVAYMCRDLEEVEDYFI